MIEHDSRHISDIFCTNFLGTTLDSTVYWKTHIDQLLHKLSSSCYTVRVFKTNYATRIISNGILCVFSLRNYSIIFSVILTASIFLGWKKKTIRIITGSKKKVHVLICLETWMYLLCSLSIFLLCFVIMIRDRHKLISDIHSRNTRQSSNFHQAISNMTLYQRGTYHMSLKIYSTLPDYVRDRSHNNKEFKLL